jgi:hypothetical protein
MRTREAADLEAALEAGDLIEILPDGTVRRQRGRRKAEPLTFRQPLGGEYARPSLAEFAALVLGAPLPPWQARFLDALEARG